MFRCFLVKVQVQSISIENDIYVMYVNYKCTLHGVFGSGHRVGSKDSGSGIFKCIFGPVFTTSSRQRLSMRNVKQGDVLILWGRVDNLIIENDIPIANFYVLDMENLSSTPNIIDESLEEINNKPEEKHIITENIENNNDIDVIDALDDFSDRLNKFVEISNEREENLNDNILALLENFRKSNNNNFCNYKPEEQTRDDNRTGIVKFFECNFNKIRRWIRRD